MLDGYELNSVELNAGAIGTRDAEGDMLATALIESVCLVTRNATGLANAVSLLSGTAYPIRPSGGDADATAWLNAVVANAIRKAEGDAVAYSSGQAFLEAVVPASGYAIATATLLGIPASVLGSGNASVTATLVSNGNRIKFDSGLASAVCTAANSTFDVVRNASTSAVATAQATGEPAVGVQKDASGSLLCSALSSGDALINSWLEGHATVTAYAAGEGDIHFSTKGNMSPVAIAVADATLLAKGEGNIIAAAMLVDAAVRIANTGGNALAKVNYFARATANRKGASNISGMATIIGVPVRTAKPRSDIVARAIASCSKVVVDRIGSSDALATASAVGTGFANARSYASNERTVFIRSAGVRIVTVKQELREIRVTA